MNLHITLVMNIHSLIYAGHMKSVSHLQCCIIIHPNHHYYQHNPKRQLALFNTKNQRKPTITKKEVKTTTVLKCITRPILQTQFQTHTLTIIPITKKFLIIQNRKSRMQAQYRPNQE
ncbi:hypothetical protein RND81_09G002800 [Saponaria officinalis]|uniref:Uncharacterized protein n=1 Tax=Saponaria officinalis TaxID=3572 RepID=A0AAW1IG90_SAPOF